MAGQVDGSDAGRAMVGPVRGDASGYGDRGGDHDTQADQGGAALLHGLAFIS